MTNQSFVLDKELYGVQSPAKIVITSFLRTLGGTLRPTNEAACKQVAAKYAEFCQKFIDQEMYLLWLDWMEDSGAWD